MKFCKNLQRVVDISDPEWAPYWTNYKMLKVGWFSKQFGLFASEICRRVSVEKISHHFLVCRVACDSESERIEDSSTRRHVSSTYTLPYLTSIPAAFLTSFQHLVSTETHQRTSCVSLIRRGWKTGEKVERHWRRNFD